MSVSANVTLIFNETRDEKLYKKGNYVIFWLLERLFLYVILSVHNLI
jgi:hypothetical protein